MNVTQSSKPKFQNYLLPWFDILAITAWGVLMIKYWVTGELYLLIHPYYAWLTIVTGILFLIFGVLKAIELFREQRRNLAVINNSAGLGHISLFPPGWSSFLLLVAAILGLLVSPKIFSSQTALQRGVADSPVLTRSRPQEFRTSTKSEARSLIDWIRTLNVYPEPDAYTGQKVKVQGFVIHPPEFSAQYMLISRFVITCCAADAYPVGLPVKLTQDRSAFAPDTWLEIEGKMITETLGGKRQLTIEATSLKEIKAPANPYDY